METRTSRGSRSRAARRHHVMRTPRFRTPAAATDAADRPKCLAELLDMTGSEQVPPRDSPIRRDLLRQKPDTGVSEVTRLRASAALVRH